MMATTGTRALPSAGALLVEAERLLLRSGVESARLDAELLMAAACGAARTALIAGTVTPAPAQIESFHRMAGRRAAREPLAYIIGRKDFFSLELEVTPATLIPRPETETLAEAALAFLAARRRARVLDIGAGCGALALALAANAPHAAVTGTDIFKETLEVARRNAARHRLAARVTFVAADLFPSGAAAPFDLIVSNPPYVESAAIGKLAPEIRLYEPRAALDGGSDGLAFYRRIARRAAGYLAPGGAIMAEAGAGQAPEVEALLRAGGFGRTGTVRDLGGVERVILARAA